MGPIAPSEKEYKDELVCNVVKMPSEKPVVYRLPFAPGLEETQSSSACPPAYVTVTAAAKTENEHWTTYYSKGKRRKNRRKMRERHIHTE